MDPHQLHPSDAQPETSQPAHEVKPVQPTKKKWMIPAACGGALVVVAVAVGIGAYGHTSNPPAPVVQSGAYTTATRSQAPAASSSASAPAQGQAAVADTVAATLPSCGANPLLTTLPIPDDHILDVSPLGNINPPGHTTPSDHIGIGLTFTTAPSTTGRPGDAKRTIIPSDFLAPADSTIFKIHAQSVTIGSVTNSDYSLFYHPCRELTLYNNHVPELNKTLMDYMAAHKAEASCQTQPNTSNEIDSFCDYPISLSVKAGTVLGRAGSGSETTVGIDFGAYDTRTAPLPYLDTELSKTGQAAEILHSVCPIDYFPTTLQNVLYAKIGSETQKRTAQPLCGEVMQDKAGTVQGNWYVTGSQLENWSTVFAMVHDSVDPTVGVVSVGGTLGQPGMLRFVSQQSGTTNLDPGLTKPGTLYCYASDGKVAGGLVTGQVLVQLSEDGTLRAEEQPGSCTGTLAFKSPTAYSRNAH